MHNVTWNAPLIAMQVGVILIAAVLWVAARRDARRRQLVRNIATILRNGEREQSDAIALKRAA